MGDGRGDRKSLSAYLHDSLLTDESGIVANPSRGLAQRNHWLCQWSKTAHASTSARLVFIAGSARDINKPPPLVVVI